MKYIDSICVDAGTVNCPCILAETGDCFVCSRLSGKSKCDCNWCGVCIYNEFIQNGRNVVNRRENKDVPIVGRNWYGEDVIILDIASGRGDAMVGASMGSFVFLNGTQDPFFNVPVSIMRTDVQMGTMSFMIKVTSAKTRALAEAKDKLNMRGIYRNGLLGCRVFNEGNRWLIISKGVGIAPAVNIIEGAGAEVRADMVIDTEKITPEIAVDCLSACAAVREGRVKIHIEQLQSFVEKVLEDDNTAYNNPIETYDKVFVLTSDHYIDLISAKLDVPKDKLIVANNFHMCCGEGICGACCRVNEKGETSKMCKRRQKK